MPAAPFDLQSHSIHSDGALPAAEVVARAAAAGVELLALTDHDTIDGVAEARAAAGEHGIAFAPPPRSRPSHGEPEDLHILGYGSTTRTPTCATALHDFRGDRARRIERMADALRGARLRARRRAARAAQRGRQADRAPAPGGRRARPPGQRAAARGRGHRRPRRAVPALPRPGRRRPTCRAAARPSPQAIEVIHAAGGVAVWAHPFWDIDRDDEALATLERSSRRASTASRPSTSPTPRDQTRCCTTRPRERGLLTTGSADFHGPEHERFNAFRAFELLRARAQPRAYRGSEPSR